ncbi:MAG TPA: hypothetical protein VL490_10800 [Mucilaginibacter sp.]|jgi:hypothetical protein|nr:hypothetical protein [Mucilaginibacter sp.]
MKSIFSNTYLVEYTFTICIYESILADLKNSINSTLTISRLIEEGYTINEGKELYNRIAANPNHYAKVVEVLSRLISNQMSIYERAGQVERTQSSYVDKYNPQKEMVYKINHIALYCTEELGKEFAKFLLKKMISAMTGFNIS